MLQSSEEERQLFIKGFQKRFKILQFSKIWDSFRVKTPAIERHKFMIFS